MALNADGTRNSCANPAAAGSTVSFFLHGIGAIQLGFGPASAIPDLAATVGECGAQVTSANLTGNFVYQAKMTMPLSSQTCSGAPSSAPAAANYQLPVTFTYGGTFGPKWSSVGPFTVPALGSPPFNPPAQPMPMLVYVKP